MISACTLCIVELLLARRCSAQRRRRAQRAAAVPAVRVPGRVPQPHGALPCARAPRQGRAAVHAGALDMRPFLLPLVDIYFAFPDSSQDRNLQRMRPYSAVQEDFLPCGRLYEHRAQLLLWASFRGQVLARTVDGMCMYRLALAMQAVQDAMTNGGYISYRVPAARAAAEGGVAAARRDAAVGGRLRLSSVQKIMVRSILRVSAARARRTGCPGVLQNPMASP